MSALSLMLEHFDDSSSENEDAPETTDDEESIFVPFMNQVV